MLKDFKENYFNNNLQFILTDNNGIIIDSDQALLKVAIGEPIVNVHPFFSCINTLEESQKITIIFNCVQLGKDVMDLIVDVEMTKRRDDILVMIHDLTEHYISYQSMAQARNESIIKSELVVLKNLELEEREKFKNQFIRNFSHEIRNPLTSITSITNIIRNTQLTKEQTKMVDFLNDSNTNLKLMLEDILSIGMIASGKLRLNPKIFNLVELLELLKFTYQAKGKEQNLEFVLTSDSKVPEFVEGDRLRLYQVLTNLLDNAFKYTNEGTITLEVQFNQKWANLVSLRFIISDTGIGIHQENIEKVFESFLRPQKNKQKGVGLGLPIVKGLLELMGSKITVESQLKKGSNFYFDINLKTPLHPMKNENLKKIVKEYRGKVNQTKENKYRVLLVEDDEHVQMMLFKILLAQKCFTIDFESDGAKVMESVVNNTYDLILMDVNLPNVDGDDLTRLIRGFPFKNIKKTPIIGITANAYPDDIATYKAAGMNAIVSKPFDVEHLLQTIFKHV